MSGLVSGRIPHSVNDGQTQLRTCRQCVANAEPAGSVTFAYNSIDQRLHLAAALARTASTNRANETRGAGSNTSLGNTRAEEEGRGGGTRMDGRPHRS